MTVGTLRPRVVPLRISGRSMRMVERNLMVYRHAWTVLLSGFFEPLFYLFSITIGLGELVGDIELVSGDLVPYATYVAPALLASSAMNGPVFEAFGIFFKLRYAKIYDGVLATPVSPRDVAIGEITWSQMRGAMYAAAFVLVMLVMGLLESPWGILAFPGAMLIGLAFGAIGMAATTFMRSWQDFDLITLVTMPMFLFSATFYPLSVYPEWLQTVARISPLYHAVDMLRAFTLGTFDWSLLVHIGVLLAMVVVGITISARRVEQLLLN